MLRNFMFAAAIATTAATANAAPQVELWRLDCGRIAVGDLSVFSDTLAYTGEKKTLTDSCYVIRHGNDYMLWDTGLPATLLGKPLALNEALAPTLDRTVPDQLGEIAVKPEAISLIGISHYHFDHVGQAAGFPKARLMIGKADLEALKSKPVPFGADPSLLTPWLSGGAPLEAVEGDRDVFGDGSVVMLSAPGHTPGSHALLVRLAGKGPVLLSGDVAHFEKQFETDGVPPFNTNRADSLASMARLQSMARTLGATLIVQHDADDIAKLPAFPASAK
ncbi:MAG TPA: N-acyl homoserine lactonase family protein [Mesorhizobium sp.]|jgi:glyoxylase-like metal-dependent hydrolase (beta-lactamase superfamily II)|uniref:N-acyl homoserine lactonase family protein n=1 Tax=Mesorhizobium sp. TaxID=1871066 RepID=UPI002DDDA2B3|nr:N-acyl homoserine lactonase family protein [Mesorhizobium sp.]HEV2505521.1 N-acyl homoserine lactonase family protein [Mesorhizobium sp.]